MLSMRPSEFLADEDEIEIWDALKPLNMELFIKYWEKVEATVKYRNTEPIFKLDQYRFKHWCDSFGHYFGYRNRSGQKHGIVRSLTSASGIVESTYLHG